MAFLENLFSRRIGSASSGTKKDPAPWETAAQERLIPGQEAAYLTQYRGGFDWSRRENTARALNASMQEASRITQETEARRTEQLGYLRGEQDRASQPTITDATIQQMYGKASDAAAAEAQNMVRNLREYLGSTGVQGGAAADLGQQIEVQRLAQLRDARRDLQIFRANADATDRLNRWARAFQIGEVIGQEPSPFLSDAIQALAGVRLTQEGIGANLEAARIQAQAAESAGEQSLFGSIAGGVLGLAGSALFG